MMICDLDLTKEEIQAAVMRGWRKCGFPALKNTDPYRDLIVDEVWKVLQKSEDRGD